MKRRLERIDKSIARYLSQLETADRHGDAVPAAKVERLNSKIEKLKEEIIRLNEINDQMMSSQDRQISLTDPDARSMATWTSPHLVESHLLFPVVDPICQFELCRADIAKA